MALDNQKLTDFFNSRPKAPTDSLKKNLATNTEQSGSILDKPGSTGSQTKFDGLRSANKSLKNRGTNSMKTTRYFEEQVLRKRPYIKREWCQRVLTNPIRKEIQSDGRVRYWGNITELGNRAFRVVTLEDGVTVHNAFPDRNFDDEKENEKVNPK